jgi:ubiquinone/menaquinone biosynthesis C-methylase UbiE
LSETIQTPSEVKSCCAALYASDWARLLLGESFHPGGLPLTARLGELLELGPTDRVLDLAAGPGTSALFVAQRFGAQVDGIDYSAEVVREARERAVGRGVADRVRFHQGDAERLPFADDSFDAVICECAFCTFPDKPAAAAEIARVLRPGGRVGLADLTREGELPDELHSLLGWVTCLGDARPIEDYADYLVAAGFARPFIDPHDEALGELVRQIRGKLLGAELLAKLGKLRLPVGDFEQAKKLARAAATAIDRGRLGYSLLVARR